MQLGRQPIIKYTDGTTSIVNTVTIGGTIYSDTSGTIDLYSPLYPSLSLTNQTNMEKIQQTKVAVFKVTRNDKNEITNAEFIKEMWIQTKAGVSVEFEVGRDKDLTKYDSSELVIKQITSTIF